MRFRFPRLGSAVALAAALAASAAPSSSWADETPSPDRGLETRLKVEKTYRIHPGDTLHGVSTLLFGHRSWWPKLKALNPELADLSPDAPLPPNRTLRYLGPEIGDEYIVRKGDWLIRIAEWKYGSNSQWEKIFRANIGSIKSPDLIRPGDKLSFGAGGAIVNLDTGKLLVHGIERHPASAVESKPAAAPGSTAPAAAPPAKPRPPLTGTNVLVSLLLGLGVGGLLLGLLLGARSLLLKARTAPPAAPVQREQPVPAPAPTPDLAQGKQVGPDTRVSHPSHVSPKENLLASGDPARLDRRPGFHSITPNRRKRYLG